MKYFFIQKTFKENEKYSFYQNLPSTIEENYLREKIELKAGEVLHEVFVEAGEVKDLIDEGRYIFVSEKIKILLQQLDERKYLNFLPVDLIYLQNSNKKTRTIRYFLMQVPSVSFIDYEKSEFKGIKEEGYISKINKLVINEDSLEGHSVARFKELISRVIINEKVKEKMESMNLTAIEYIPSEEFKR